MRRRPLRRKRLGDTELLALGEPALRLGGWTEAAGEADAVRWMRPAEATAAVDDGVIRMLPPTYVTLTQLAEYATPPEALAAAADRRIRAIQPGVHVEGDQAWLVVDL